MKKSLRFDDIVRAIPEATAALLTRTVKAANAADREIYLVGGPVRDLLLGRPLVDVDLMVAEGASELAESIAGQRGEEPARVVEHPRFKTLRIETDTAGLDLATLRHETYTHPGALPDVEAGDLDQDIARRDFSINALLCPLDATRPNKGREIIDRCDGLPDLESKRLRVLHSRSFHDDPTRAWRAARFAARLGFSVDRSTRNNLRDALRDGAFGAVSGERFRRELIQTFEEGDRGTHPGRVLRSLADWHVLPALEPGLDLAKDRMAPLRRLGRAVAQPDWPAPRWRPWLAGISIWLAPLPAALRRRTLERFSIRGEQASRVVHFGRDADRTLRALAKARGRGAVDATLGSLPEETVQALYVLADTAVRRRIVRWGAEDRRRRAPVGGADLIAIGLAGPDVGRALERIRVGFLDGEIANREEALALAQEITRGRAAKTSGRKKSGRAPGSKSKRPSAGKGKRKQKPAKAKKAASAKAKLKPVAGDGAIADTEGDRRRTSTSPGNASPQADSSG